MNPLVGKETAYRRRGIRFPDAAPQNVVQLIVVRLVSFAEVQRLRARRCRRRRRISLIQGDARFLIDDIAKCLDAWAKDPSQSIHLKYTLDDADYIAAAVREVHRELIG